MKASDPEAAIEEFLGVPGLESEKGDWGFKGLKQAIKLEFKIGKYDKVYLRRCCLQARAD
jgi:COP9 signalosome complex subunit 2